MDLELIIMYGFWTTMYLVMAWGTAVFSRHMAPKGPHQVDGIFGLIWPAFWLCVFVAIIVEAIGRSAKALVGK